MILYNTLTRKKEEFIPINDKEVKMYTCGPTVYNYAHIGNLRSFIHEDILEKTLEYVGYQVKRVMNITDVGHLQSDADEGEDKMLQGAKRENKTVWEVAEYYTKAFFRDCNKLNIKIPQITCKATDYIDQYIEFIKVLEKKGYTYFVNGNVYFDISKVDDYTKLSGMNLDELKIASRDDVNVDDNKKNPQDFVLWFTKSKFENQAMKWDSPWGVGYPGWHLECSVIAVENFGNKMDIHCGGVDHIPIHHTNEICQTESYTGEKWVNYWWHGEWLVINDSKMSKSSGDFLTIPSLEEKGFDPLAYRYFILNSHYKKQLTFSFDSLDMAANAFKKLKNRINNIIDSNPTGDISENILKYKEKFKDSLEDDLNTANAITVLYDVLKADDLTDIEKLYLIEDFDSVLSISLMVVKEEEANEELVKYVEEMILKRQEAKKNKNYELADKIRNELNDKGIVLKDTRDGVKWNLI